MKLFLLFFLLIWANVSFTQVVLSANTKADVSLILSDSKLNGGKCSENIQNRFAVNSIHGIQFISFLGKTATHFSKSNLVQMGIMVGAKIGDIVSLKIPVSQLNTIASLPGLKMLQLSGKIKPNLDKAIKDIGADSVHMGINLPEGYTGKNVLIGITDWGFDYSSPMFYDTLLQNTRILAAWDQFKTSGPAPFGFSYGTEFSSSPEFIAAGADTSNIYSHATHGSHVAGIAGGSGAGTIYRGVAFEAQYLFATFLVDEGAVLDAWEWMYQKSQSEGKRLVINMSWGLYHMGTLDGNSLLSQAIDNYSLMGVVFSNSGGNNGNVPFHIKKTFTNDTIKSRIQFYDYAANVNMWGQSIHMWGEQGNSFESGLMVYNSAGQILVESPFYSTATISTYIDTFLVTGLDTIWFNISADAAHPLNGRPQMRLRVKNTNTNLRVLLKSRAVTGKVHYWNVTELSNDVGNWGMPFSFFSSGSISGDNLYGISEPSCTNSLISVAAYAPKYLTGGGSPTGGGIASFSSIGPRYDEVLKPDIAAPGVAIASSISSYTDNAFTQIAFVDFNGRTYPFAKFSGTSMASPMVTGVVALILEANPYLSAQQVKDIIIISAREDNNTGVIPATGSTQWGWGKIDAYQAIQLALNTIGFEEIEHEIQWTVYPNPVVNELHFTLVDELPLKVMIIDIMGKTITRNIQDSRLSVADLKPGTYWIRMEINGRIEQQAFVKQ
jgi:subtilisin family serine protease